jgi:hypothetical protein
MIEEAVSIYHPLATEFPDVFCPNLALSLCHISYCLSQLGQHEEAFHDPDD